MWMKCYLRNLGWVLNKEAKPVRRVIIIKTHGKRYRVPFYRKLREALMSDGVEFTVLYGVPSKSEQTKSDSVELPTEFSCKIRSWYFWGDRFLLQWPGIKKIANADLVIVVNANRNLINLPLMLLSKLHLKRVAFWGHGANHQRVGSSLSEVLKRFLVTQPDWWFAYTAHTAEYLTTVGFDPRRITTINNAIDTSDFSSQVGTVSFDQIVSMRERLDLRETHRVGLYCGSLYPEKRLPFLLKAAELVAKEIPDFKLLIIGSGVEEMLVQEACNRYDFVRYAGPLFGIDKAICYRIAEMVLNPGLVGLGVLDSFAAGLPFITLTDSLHSPEISYINDGENGLLVSGNEVAYAKAIIGLMEGGECWDLLCRGATKSGEKYTINNMVENCRNGILACLDS